MTRTSSSSSSPDETRRLRSTLKEKKRNIEINDAFEKLQRQLPHVPSSTRLPKIKTLRLALKYIEHLSTILSGDAQYFQMVSDYMSAPRPLCIEDFAAVAMQEIQIRNSYTERARSEENSSNSSGAQTSSSPLLDHPQPSSPLPYLAPSSTHHTVYQHQQPSYHHSTYQQSYFWHS
ncbi:hypothetical protein Q1695_008847 [Nippostrongylus brasiliensis]|nr:hypothetical protein Q1695_008847 [Nippostrongylus brasiliensis]